jgi:hypothetical protein
MTVLLSCKKKRFILLTKTFSTAHAGGFVLLTKTFSTAHAGAGETRSRERFWTRCFIAGHHPRATKSYGEINITCYIPWRTILHAGMPATVTVQHPALPKTVRKNMSCTS